MIAYTQQIARQNAEFGVRAWGKPRAEIVAAGDAKMPLRRRMGTAWDVAYAALFLASDAANFITRGGAAGRCWRLAAGGRLKQSHKTKAA